MKSDDWYQDAAYQAWKVLTLGKVTSAAALLLQAAEEIEKAHPDSQGGAELRRRSNDLITLAGDLLKERLSQSD